MKIPAFLKPGDTIGLAAPSFGAAIEPYATRLKAAIETFEKRGYRVKCAPSVYKSDGLGISTDPASAAADLMELYLDDGIDAVLSVGGGELMCETISYVDFERLGKAKPKWFMGYSDNTNFIMPMAVIGGVPGIYGPCAPQFGRPWTQTEEDAFALLEGKSSVVRGYEKYELPFGGEDEPGVEKDPLAPYEFTEPKILSSYIPCGKEMRKAESDDAVEIKGTLLGGCLDILTNLAGTEFDRVGDFCRDHGDIIWVLEACDLNPMSVRRAVWSLSHCGWFDTASGFLVGRPLAAYGQDQMGVNQYNAVLDILAEYGVPVIMDCDIGHVAPMMPLIIGAKADVHVLGNDIQLDMYL